MHTSQKSHRGIVAIILALIAYGSLYPLSISLEAGNADTTLGSDQANLLKRIKNKGDFRSEFRLRGPFFAPKTAR